MILTRSQAVCGLFSGFLGITDCCTFLSNWHLAPNYNEVMNHFFCLSNKTNVSFSFESTSLRTWHYRYTVHLQTPGLQRHAFGHLHLHVCFWESMQRLWSSKSATFCSVWASYQNQTKCSKLLRHPNFPRSLWSSIKLWKNGHIKQNLRVLEKFTDSMPSSLFMHYIKRCCIIKCYIDVLKSG